MQWCKKVYCRHALTKAQLHDALVNVRRSVQSMHARWFAGATAASCHKVSNM